MDNTVDTTVVAETKKTRKSPDLKEKVVEFTITKEMRLADLVDTGYQRKEVEKLFTEMQTAGHGTYIAGHLGRGCSAKFVCGDAFPEKYTITMQVRRLRNEYIGKPVAAETIPATVAESVVIPAEQSWLTAEVKTNDTEPVPAEIVEQKEETVSQ